MIRDDPAARQTRSGPGVNNCNAVKICMRPRALGEFEQLILFALVALPAEECYGVPIRALIERRTGRSLSAGAVFTGLERLTARGLVSSDLGEPTAERGGRRKRMYRLEAAGARELARSVQTLQVMSEGLLPQLELRIAGSTTRTPRKRG
jgi:PadR family transcriptional regulator, regulatory protein PadR